MGKNYYVGRYYSRSFGLGLVGLTLFGVWRVRDFRAIGYLGEKVYAHGNADEIRLCDDLAGFFAYDGFQPPIFLFSFSESSS